MTTADRARRHRARRRGHLGEAIALWLLRAKGYRILAQRFIVRGGEIDIIARRGSTLAFVEVKWRPTLTEAIEAIDARKRRRIGTAARVFLAGRDTTGLTLRGDAICLMPWRWPRHLANAFELTLD